jgi:hypothetical protein
MPKIDDYISFMVEVVKGKSLKAYGKRISACMQEVWANPGTQKGPRGFIERVNKRLEAEQSEYGLALENVHGPVDGRRGGEDGGPGRRKTSYNAELVLVHNKTEEVDRIVVDIVILH